MRFRAAYATAATGIAPDEAPALRVLSAGVE